MELEEAIRTRRTHKQFDPEPLDHSEIEALVDLARWAPNHRLTNPWRFRVLGPGSRARVEAAADELQPGGSFKLRRAPTMLLVTTVASGDQHQDDEDRLATAAAIYGLLLGAHARGLAGFWNTPGVLSSPAGRQALRLPEAERPVGLLHLGRPNHAPVARDRAPLDQVVSYLD
jgi:nitroreductase